MNDTLIQKQVCTLEQGNKLAFLGFKQKSLFYHIENKTVFSFQLDFSDENNCSAYTETELKAFMPYGRTYPNLSVQQQADFLIKLIEVEGIDVEEYNTNYKEFFEIE